MSHPSTDDGIEVWRGGVNTWECDEMGHMNVRFYVVKAMEGLAGLARHLGMPHAFSAGAAATLLVREHHVRFLKEAHAGAPLHMTARIIDFDEAGAVVHQMLVHTRTNDPCASVITRVVHASPGEGRAFPWPARAVAAAERLKGEVPAFARPRSIPLDPFETRASLERADTLGLYCAGRGAIAARDCDVFGRMGAEQFIGRVSDGVPGLLGTVRSRVADASPDRPKRVGGAVLEYRLVYLDWPLAGDHVEIRSGLAGFDDKTQRMNHWLLDPVSGQPWGTAEAVAVSFDLDKRKIIPIAPDLREALSAFVTPGMSL